MNSYEQLSVIGQGQYGTAYKAKHKGDGQWYCVKRIALGNKENHTDALREAQVLSQLSHPNIISYKESFLEKDGALCIVTSFCEEGDLFNKIKKKSSSKQFFSEEEVMDLFIQIASALEYIHSRKILHRDLKTQNIFLSQGGIVKLGDFGISKVLECTDQFATTVTGTPYYMAPEICTNQPYTLKSDIWSLGCVLYELCTLKHAFVADSLLSLVYQIVRGNFPPIPSERFSNELSHLVNSLLVRDANNRPSLAQMFQIPYVQKQVSRMLVAQQKWTLKAVGSINRRRRGRVAGDADLGRGTNDEEFRNGSSGRGGKLQNEVGGGRREGNTSGDNRRQRTYDDAANVCMGSIMSKDVNANNDCNSYASPPSGIAPSSQGPITASVFDAAVIANNHLKEIEGLTPKQRLELKKQKERERREMELKLACLGAAKDRETAAARRQAVVHGSNVGLPGSGVSSGRLNANAGERTNKINAISNNNNNNIGPYTPFAPAYGKGTGPSYDYSYDMPNMDTLPSAAGSGSEFSDSGSSRGGSANSNGNYSAHYNSNYSNNNDASAMPNTHVNTQRSGSSTSSSKKMMRLNVIAATKAAASVGASTSSSSPSTPLSDTRSDSNVSENANSESRGLSDMSRLQKGLAAAMTAAAVMQQSDDESNGRNGNTSNLGYGFSSPATNRNAMPNYCNDYADESDDDDDHVLMTSQGFHQNISGNDSFNRNSNGSMSSSYARQQQQEQSSFANNNKNKRNQIGNAYQISGPNVNGRVDPFGATVLSGRNGDNCSGTMMMDRSMRMMNNTMTDNVLMGTVQAPKSLYSGPNSFNQTASYYNGDNGNTASFSNAKRSEVGVLGGGNFPAYNIQASVIARSTGSASPSAPLRSSSNAPVGFNIGGGGTGFNFGGGGGGFNFGNGGAFGGGGGWGSNNGNGVDVPSSAKVFSPPATKVGPVEFGGFKFGVDESDKSNSPFDSRVGEVNGGGSGSNSGGGTSMGMINGFGNAPNFLYHSQVMFGVSSDSKPKGSFDLVIRDSSDTNGDRGSANVVTAAVGGLQGGGTRTYTRGTGSRTLEDAINTAKQHRQMNSTGADVHIDDNDDANGYDNDEFEDYSDDFEDDDDAMNEEALEEEVQQRAQIIATVKDMTATFSAAAAASSGAGSLKEAILVANQGLESKKLLGNKENGNNEEGQGMGKDVNEKVVRDEKTLALRAKCIESLGEKDFWAVYRFLKKTRDAEEGQFSETDVKEGLLKAINGEKNRLRDCFLVDMLIYKESML